MQDLEGGWQSVVTEMKQCFDRLKQSLTVRKGVSIRSGQQIGPGSCFLQDFKVEIDVSSCGQEAEVYLGCKPKLLGCAKGTWILQAQKQSILTDRISNSKVSDSLGFGRTVSHST